MRWTENKILKTVHGLLYHVKQANLLMRATDFNDDGQSDCIGLHVKDIRVITDPRISIESIGSAAVTEFSNYWTWGFPRSTATASSAGLSPEDYIKMFSK